MNLLKLTLVTSFALLSIGSKAQLRPGTLSTKTQADINFAVSGMSIPEIGNLNSFDKNYINLDLDQILYIQVSNLYQFGIGAGIGLYSAEERRFFSSGEQLVDAGATHLRMSVYNRIISRFSDKIGMMHEIQFRLQYGTFERLSFNNGEIIQGNVNILGLGYNPTLYYFIKDNISLEASIHGLTILRTRFSPREDEFFFFNPEILPRLKMGLSVGMTYHFAQPDPEKESTTKKKKRKRRKR
ncbi:MAG: hypothetical protein R2879_08840 [Saprospiraceae bacterium]